MISQNIITKVGRFQMELKRVSSFDDKPTEIEYLDTNALVLNTLYTRLAFVTGATTGLSKLEQGFVTFYLKDCNANIVSARLFNVADWVNSGINALQFKKRPVKVRFVAQEFNNRTSLVIDGVEGIELWNGDFDYNKFIGKVEYNAEALDKLYTKILGYSLPIAYSSTSLHQLASGRIGALPKVIELVSNYLMALGDLPDCKVDELLEIYLHVMTVYGNILIQTEKYENLSTNMLFDLLATANMQFRDNENYDIIMDTVRALVKVSKPGHLYANIIQKAMDLAVSTVNMAVTSSNMILGAKTTVGGGELLKY